MMKSLSKVTTKMSLHYNGNLSGKGWSGSPNEEKKKAVFWFIYYHFQVWVLKISISRLISDLNIWNVHKNPSLKFLKRKIFVSFSVFGSTVIHEAGERSKSIRKVVCLFVCFPEKKHRNSTQSNFHLSLLHRRPNKWILLQCSPLSRQLQN